MTVDDRKLAHLREQCEFNAISDDKRVEWWQLVYALSELEERRQQANAKPENQR